MYIGFAFLLAFLPASGVSGDGITRTGQATALAMEKTMLASSPEQAALQITSSLSPDPSTDTAWSAGTAGVADIQTAFNNARTRENSQLGTVIPMLTLPAQTTWNNMTTGEKALWLINRERIDRGIRPLDGLESNVGAVAQGYADYLLGNNAWGHSADGRDPWQRLSARQAIAACHDFLPIGENLAVFVTSGSSIALPLERSIYMWMYDDGDCCGWGHRHAVLWDPYNNNSGASGSEGFLGIGRASGGPYQGGFSQSWNLAEIIVMNVFDPCSSWVELFPPGAAAPVAPSGAVASVTPTFSWNVPPDTGSTDPATWYLLWVNGPSGAPVIKQWYTAAQANCNGSSCSVTSANALTGGNHTWWVQTWNATGYGPWSPGMSFTVSAERTTGKATLVSPNGTGVNLSPAYTWNEVVGATWYYLWVNGPSGAVIQQWYTSAQANCNGTTCSVTPAKVLSSGAHTWWVQTWNDSGYGPWSDGMAFTRTAPGKATLISPIGTMGTSAPTYTWNEVSGATWYYLWVNGPSGSVIQQWYTAAQAGCNGTICSVTPGTALGAGDHTWWIQAWNNAGYGPWSNGLGFSVAP